MTTPKTWISCYDVSTYLYFSDFLWIQDVSSLKIISSFLRRSCSVKYPTYGQAQHIIFLEIQIWEMINVLRKFFDIFEKLVNRCRCTSTWRRYDPWNLLTENWVFLHHVTSFSAKCPELILHSITTDSPSILSSSRWEIDTSNHYILTSKIIQIKNIQ